MCKKNIFYKYPLLYVWGLKWIHKNNFAKRYCYMASFVKKNDLVLEPGCGPATLAEWSEKDGTNDFKVEYFLTRGQLLNQIEYGFDIISSSVERETRDFGEDIIAVFFKDKNSHQRLKKQKFVSAIVPVFNEEKTVAKVIKTLAKTSLVNEVICINDGSTDKSLSILKKFGDKITLIDLKKNQGKGFALAEGIKKAKSEIIAFIDADLTTLSDNHIKTLLEPILDGKVRAVLGYPSNRRYNA